MCITEKFINKTSGQIKHLMFKLDLWMSCFITI